MSVPVNDLCVNALAITSLPFAAVVNTTEATDDPGLDCGNGNGYNGVWYKWTAPAGQHRIGVICNDPDFLGQVVTMFSGTCGALVYKLCADYDFPAPGSLDDVTPGETYYFLLTSIEPGGFSAFSWGLIDPPPTGQFCLTVSCVPLELGCPPAPKATLGRPFESALEVSNGIAPFTFAITAGALPPGLTLDAVTGVIAGTPTGLGAFSYTAQVVDAADHTATVSCGLGVTAREAIRWVRRFPHINEQNLRLFISRLEFEMQRGVGLDGVGQGTSPQIMLKVSRDGGMTWSGETWLSPGQIGAYTQRVFRTQLGSARDFVFEVSGSDPVQIALADCYVTLQAGTS